MSNVLNVIVSYNGGQMTRECVNMMLVQDHPTSVVLWDNNSTDDTVALLQPLLDESVDFCLVPNPANILWTPACNKAVDFFLQDHEYILIMNNDIFLPRNAVSEMVKVFEEEENVGMVAPWGSRLGGLQDKATWADQVPGTYPLRASYLLGACVMISTKAWKEVGPFAWDMPLGADDHDYCLRMKHAGYKLMVCRTFQADHVGHASSHTPEGRQSWSDNAARSWDAFNRKWDGYFRTEDEAIKGHWDGRFYPGFERGTGWDDETYYNRVIVGDY